MDWIILKSVYFYDMLTQRANVLAAKLTLVQIRDVNKFAPTPPLTTTSTPNLPSVVKGG